MLEELNHKEMNRTTGGTVQEYDTRVCIQVHHIFYKITHIKKHFPCIQITTVSSC